MLGQSGTNVDVEGLGLCLMFLFRISVNRHRTIDNI